MKDQRKVQIPSLPIENPVLFIFGFQFSLKPELESKQFDHYQIDHSVQVCTILDSVDTDILRKTHSYTGDEDYLTLIRREQPRWKAASQVSSNIKLAGRRRGPPSKAQIRSQCQLRMPKIRTRFPNRLWENLKCCFRAPLAEPANCLHRLMLLRFTSFCTFLLALLSQVAPFHHLVTEDKAGAVPVGFRCFRAEREFMFFKILVRINFSLSPWTFTIICYFSFWSRNTRLIEFCWQIWWWFWWPIYSSQLLWQM